MNVKREIPRVPRELDLLLCITALASIESYIDWSNYRKLPLYSNDETYSTTYEIDFGMTEASSYREE